MQHVIVTGGYGFIGSNFIHHLLQRNSDVFVHNIDMMTYAANKSNLDGIDATRHKHYELDLSWDWNSNTIKELIGTHAPTHIVHFAAESHVDRSIHDKSVFIRSNIMGTINVLEAIKESRLRPELVYIGTDEVYGSLPLGDDPDFSDSFMEHDPYRPSSPYSASKAAAEGFVYAYGATWQVPFKIVNCANAYGPRQHPEKLIPKAILNALKGHVIPVYGQGVNERQWTYVTDICHAIETVMDLGTIGDKYNIGSNDCVVNNNELIHLMLTLLNRPKSLIQYVKDRPGHDLKYRVNTFQLEGLGWKQQVDLYDGLNKTIKWYMNSEYVK